MQRQIWLTDKDNKERFDFSAFGSFIFTSPTSLGIYREKSFLVVGNQRIETSDLPSFKEITATIIIKGKYSELEQKYSQFRDFVSKHIKNGFRLYVKTQMNVGERYINCSIESIDKTEKTTANTMNVPITILPKSLWLGDVEGASIQKVVDSVGAFRFEQRDIGIYSARFEQRDYVDEYGRTYYSTTLGGGSFSEAYLYNGGEETTPLIVRIYGQSTNPFVKLKDYQSGQIVQSVKFEGLVVPDGYYLEINSNPENSYIELVNESTGERYDVEDYASHDTTVFMKLPVGNYILETSDDVADNIVSTRVFFANQYKGA